VAPAYLLAHVRPAEAGRREPGLGTHMCSDLRISSTSALGGADLASSPKGVTGRPRRQQ